MLRTAMFDCSCEVAEQFADRMRNDGFLLKPLPPPYRPKDAPNAVPGHFFYEVTDSVAEVYVHIILDARELNSCDLTLGSCIRIYYPLRWIDRVLFRDPRRELGAKIEVVLLSFGGTSVQSVWSINKS